MKSRKLETHANKTPDKITGKTLDKTRLGWASLATMLKIKRKLGILLFGLMVLSNTSQAALNDLGNGLVNDDVLNITWMQDANLFKTLCDANDPIATGFSPVDTTNAATVCTNNGAMTWNDAEKWILRLNDPTINYLGGGWRQPATAQPDPACSFQIANAGFPDQDYGYNCANVGSELNHLFYTSLNNPNHQDDSCFGTAPHCFQNTAPFSNPQAFAYWSGSEFAPNTAFAWDFFTSYGYQSYDFKDNSNLFVWPVRSAPFTVTKIADTDDGICDADCSLREAIKAANDSASNDTINFASPLFDTPQTITLGGTQLLIANNGKLTINGPVTGQLSISGSNASRVLNVAPDADVEINNLTIMEGNEEFGSGGGIYNFGIIVLNNSTVRNNSAATAGGIYNDGILVLNNSTVRNNSAATVGGIYNHTASSLTLNNSTISNNTTTGNGGAIFIGSITTVTLNNSTVSNNSAVDFGGGIYNLGGSVTLSNSIIANNTSDADCYNTGTFNATNSLIEDASCGVVDGISNNKTGDPLLGPLQDNGGPTFTHALLQGSIAINAGDNTLIPTGIVTDQRGAGFPRIFESTVDMGAFEFQQVSNTAPTIITDAVSVNEDSNDSQQLAAVTDAEDNDGDLSVSIVGASSANGVTISNLTVGSLGIVWADIVTECGATDASFELKVTDSGGLMANASLDVTVTPETEAPVINTVADIEVFLPMNSSATSMVVSFDNPTATDNCDTNVTVTTNPASGSVFPLGETTVTVNAVDDAGNSAESLTFTVRVLYNFTGFFNPIRDGLNKAKAGRAIPVKFSLSGDKGLNILETGYPISYQTACSGAEDNGEELPTNTSGNSSLSYDASSDQYKYTWKTSKSWKGSCRKLVVKLNDGTTHTADFKFK